MVPRQGRGLASAIYNDEKSVKDLIRCAVYTSVIVTVINVFLLPYVMPTGGPSITALCTTVTQDREYTYIGDDFPTQAPVTLSRTTHILTTGEPHHGLYADLEWGALFPSNDGFVTLGPTTPSDPDRSGTPRNASNATGTPDPHGRTFLVSVVHQLHCLDTLRVAVATRARTDAGGRGAHAATHAEHCLRYLLQLALCHADATLERDEPGVRDGRWEHAASGVGAAHRCRDWRALWDWMEAHPPGPVVVNSEEA